MDNSNKSIYLFTKNGKSSHFFGSLTSKSVVHFNKKLADQHFQAIKANLLANICKSQNSSIIQKFYQVIIDSELDPYYILCKNSDNNQRKWSIYIPNLSEAMDKNLML